MSLRSAVEQLTFVARPLPARGATARLAASLSSASPVEAPSGDLNIVAGRFLDNLRLGVAPSSADWNKVAWCLWTTSPPIAQHDLALGALLDRVVHMIRMERKRPYRQLASAYLTDFAIDRPRLEQISHVLRGYASAAGEPWEKLQTKYAVFDGAEAAAGLARVALKERISVQEVFKSANVSGPILGGEFARAAHDEGLKFMLRADVSTAAEHIDAVRRWSLQPDERLFFEKSKVEFARAVVLPFGQRTTTRTDRGVISNFIISRFGDPRTNRARWIGMDDVADILRRWLTEQSLLQFLDVVDQIAHQDTWTYRRAFWLAYHKAELVQNAWVVFGEDGASHARRAFGKEVLFGRFRAGGSKPIEQGHAVLLLDFGPCVVADWSHNGRCNIWRKSDPTCPKDLYASGYTSDQIRRRAPPYNTEATLNGNDIFSHHGSENYVWQDRVADRLQQLIGIRIPKTAYRVR